MILELTYKEMAYIRQLLQIDNPRKDSIDDDIRKEILKKLSLLERDYAEGLIS